MLTAETNDFMKYLNEDRTSARLTEEFVPLVGKHGLTNALNFRSGSGIYNHDQQMSTLCSTIRTYISNNQINYAHELLDSQEIMEISERWFVYILNNRSQEWGQHAVKISTLVSILIDKLRSWYTQIDVPPVLVAPSANNTLVDSLRRTR